MLPTHRRRGILHADRTAPAAGRGRPRRTGGDPPRLGGHDLPAVRVRRHRQLHEHVARPPRRGVPAPGRRPGSRPLRRRRGGAACCSPRSSTGRGSSRTARSSASRRGGPTSSSIPTPTRRGRRSTRCTRRARASPTATSRTASSPSGDFAARNVLHVDDLVTLTPEARVALWHFVCDVDLVETIKAAHVPIDDPIRWLLRETRRLRVERVDRLAVAPHPRRAGGARSRGVCQRGQCRVPGRRPLPARRPGGGSLRARRRPRRRRPCAAPRRRPT